MFGKKMSLMQAFVKTQAKKEGNFEVQHQFYENSAINILNSVLKQQWSYWS